MSMPKGHKMENGYATIADFSGGKGYREIAEIMTDSGYKMNHSTARNVFINAMKKLAVPLHEMYDMPSDDCSILETAKDPRFQEGVIEILQCMDSEADINI